MEIKAHPLVLAVTLGLLTHHVLEVFSEDEDLGDREPDDPDDSDTDRLKGEDK